MFSENHKAALDGFEREEKKQTPGKRDIPESEGKTSERENRGYLDLLRKAGSYGATVGLLIPDRVIPKHEEREDIFEVKVARASKPREMYDLFTTHKPGYDRAYLSLLQLKAQKGEGFLIRSVTKYEPESFVKSYNENRPKGLQNTELATGEGRFSLKIDEKEIELKDASLWTDKGLVILEGKLGMAGEMKIAKGIEGFSFRLKDHSPVTSMKADERGAALTYQRTDHDKHPHTRFVAEFKGARTEGTLHSIELRSEGIEVERPIEQRNDTVGTHFTEQDQRLAWETPVFGHHEPTDGALREAFDRTTTVMP